MSNLKINNITDRTGGSGPVIAGVSTVTSTGAFTVPVGPTEMRGGRGRAVIGGGNNPSDLNVLEKIEIVTTGNAVDFGDLSQLREQPQAASSSTRGVWSGGKTSSTIDYVILSSEGGSSTFGDLNQSLYGGKGVSDGTTALWMGGTWSGGYNGLSPIQFTVIASNGSASYFGDISDGRVYGQTGAFASHTRGLIGGGGGRYSPNYQNTIDYITIATKGDTKDFGDISAIRKAAGGCASPTRGLFMGGQAPGPSYSDVIDYVTIATTGNAIDFGNLTQARGQTDGGSSHTRGFCPGGDNSARVNTIDYVTIASLGNATDFGDMTGIIRFTGTCSDSHGGIE
tara:strand:+ start:959 stop:1978 length:1020 start_codon:yes stop_codon:yes gene_type:complete